MAFPGSNAISEVGLRLLLCPIGSNVVTRAACCSVGIVLPVYSTFRAIERNIDSEQQKWLVYWAAYGSFTLVEVISDKFLSWFPYYYHFKFAFLVWLQLPTTEGAKQIYNDHLRPVLLRHHAKVDRLMDFAHAGMERFISKHQGELKFVRIMFRRMLGSDPKTKGGVHEQSEPRGLREIEHQTRMITNQESDHDD